jgi:hypothetical protein
MTQQTPGQTWNVRQDARQAAAMQQQHQRLTQALPFRRVYYKSLKKGSLVYAQYLFWAHDANPLILVTDNPHPKYPDQIRGVNLHYLTFKYVKSLLQLYCGKEFDFKYIAHDPYIVQAFRTYKRAGLRNLQLLDCEVINLQFQERRRAYKYNPQELKIIRDQLRQQLERLAHPRASELAGQYAEMLNTQQGFQAPPQQDARRAYQPGVVYPSP